MTVQLAVTAAVVNVFPASVPPHVPPVVPMSYAAVGVIVNEA